MVLLGWHKLFATITLVSPVKLYVNSDQFSFVNETSRWSRPRSILKTDPSMIAPKDDLNLEISDHVCASSKPVMDSLTL